MQNPPIKPVPNVNIFTQSVNHYYILDVYMGLGDILMYVQNVYLPSSFTKCIENCGLPDFVTDYQIRHLGNPFGLPKMWLNIDPGLYCHAIIKHSTVFCSGCLQYQKVAQPQPVLMPTATMQPVVEPQPMVMATCPSYPPYPPSYPQQPMLIPQPAGMVTTPGTCMFQLQVFPHSLDVNY